MDEDLEKIFFELSNENRNTILRILKNEDLKMQEIANRLDITATEVFRQLQRLGDVKLVTRTPDGLFQITPFGRLILHQSKIIELTTKHREYFLTHDPWALPLPFMNRLGELFEVKLETNVVESINKSVQIFLEAEEYAWGSSEHGSGPDYVDPFIDKQVEKGVTFKLIVPENTLSPEQLEDVPQNIEIKSLQDCNIVVVVSEKEAAVYLPLFDGRMDYVGFNGRNPVFLGWARDLFMYYWEKGKPL